MTLALTCVAASMGRRQRWLPLLAFVAFSGADGIGTLVTGFRFGPPWHLEWWIGWMEYGSHATSLFWVPQHAIPAWLGIAVLMRAPQAGLPRHAAL